MWQEGGSKLKTMTMSVHRLVRIRHPGPRFEYSRQTSVLTAPEDRIRSCFLRIHLGLVWFTHILVFLKIEKAQEPPRMNFRCHLRSRWIQDTRQTVKAIYWFAPSQQQCASLFSPISFFRKIIYFIAITFEGELRSNMSISFFKKIMYFMAIIFEGELGPNMP